MTQMYVIFRINPPCATHPIRIYAIAPEAGAEITLAAFQEMHPTLKFEVETLENVKEKYGRKAAAATGGGA